MSAYELTIVLPGKSSPAKVKKQKEQLEKLVSGLKGEVKKVNDWGEKNLAYQIRKNDSGIFLNYELELESSGAKALPAKLNLEEEIIRYLLVRKE